MTRRVTINTPLADQLQLRRLQGREEISHLFALEIDLLGEHSSIDPKALLGQGATVAVQTQDGGTRYIDGLITGFGMRGQDEHRNFLYRARLSPWLWLATRRSDFRIFQNKTVPDILRQVLGLYGHPMEQRLTRSYRTWEYCVQYNETDFQFASRLMEHEGIYYFHQHSAGQHVLTMCDDIIASHSPLPGGAVIAFHPPGKAAAAREECIHAWELNQCVKPGQHYNDDYDFKKPRADLSNMRRTPPGHAHDTYEIYEWPGGYTDPGDGQDYVRVRLQQSLTRQSTVQGRSNHRALAPGYTFTLDNYPRSDQNQSYLITAVDYAFEENARASDSGEGSVQKFVLQAQPTSLPFKPERATPKPHTTGPQTAVVVGPPGEEIWTDQYGRIKVQFHWDRLGSMNENSSCWMRVATSWAGPGFGAIHIPRIGMEVIVDFLNGDPDYPIVMGCVYNAANMPPWALPANATQSGIKTRSSKGGSPGAGMKNGAGDANAIRFEDKAGAEQLWLHAQKDQLTEVENDEDKWVGNDRRKTIDRDETSVIHRDRTETVDRNEKINVHGWRTEEVDQDETLTVHQNRQRTVDLNESVRIGQSRNKTVGKHEKDKIGRNWSITVGRFKTETIGIAYMQNAGVAKMVNIGVAYNLNVGMTMLTNVGNSRKDTTGKTHDISVGDRYELKVGSAPGSSITMDGKSITLKVGKSMIVMQADGTIAINGNTIDVVGSKHIGMESDRIDLN
ncbi:type VI secretion system Vgr family protein [Delftia sp. PS-11]|uniref:type VI secretion system Vgr family protein n=1 Tax=Delftia sp. PS-11 TaxID=2767222 RepID=UPI0024558D78|nr:type VI secretion system tip protein TssI/VgrG [Delftia sp. PS-11]KAJ8743935.1 type VI secretion system tip protein VgrG [Delftia sp. PS-11]